MFWVWGSGFRVERREGLGFNGLGFRSSSSELNLGLWVVQGWISLGIAVATLGVYVEV